MRKKFTDKQQQVALFLYNDDEMNYNRNITQNDLAHLLGVSQSAISQGLAKAGYRLEIAELQRELEDTRAERDAYKTALASFIAQAQHAALPGRTLPMLPMLPDKQSNIM